MLIVNTTQIKSHFATVELDTTEMVSDVKKMSKSEVATLLDVDIMLAVSRIETAREVADAMRDIRVME